MYTTTKRIYREDEAGHRILVHDAGTRITDDEAASLGLAKGKSASAAPAITPPATADTPKAKPSYDDLKAEAIALGLKFAGNLGSIKLTSLIDEEKARLAAIVPPTHKLGATSTVTVDDVEVELVYDETDKQWIHVDGGEPWEGDTPDPDGTDDDTDGDGDPAAAE